MFVHLLLHLKEVVHGNIVYLIIGLSIV